MTRINHRWIIRKFAEEFISEQNFEWVEESLPALQEGQVLVKQHYLSLDPTNRIWLSGKETYLPALQIGEVMRGVGVGEVIESQNPAFQVGDLVSGLLGWQSHYLGDGKTITAMPKIPNLPLTAYLEVFGFTSFTAYYGLLEIGKVQSGQNILVSAAAGAVGSVVGQIAKIKGCKVVGLAGTDQKCAWLKEIGFDYAINYKTENIAQKIHEYFPDGIDVYFDNVGGQILDIAIGQMKVGGRIPVCGLISGYNDKEPIFTSQNFGNILIKRITLQGFIISDHYPHAKNAFAQMGQWYMEGKLKFRLDITEGLENAPQTVNKLFDGTNTGKLAIRIA